MEQQDLLEFIHFFTHNKNLTKSQRRKLDVLLARDCVMAQLEETNSQNIETELEKDVPKELIKRHRNGVNNEGYVSPLHLQNFLREYNQDKYLKYTCHLIDADEIVDDICKECNTEGYDFEEHRKLICDRFYRLRERYKEEDIFLNPNMVTLINAYLTGKDLKGNDKCWSSNDIQINWSSILLREWAKHNPSIIPNPGKNIAKKQRNNGFKLEDSFKSKTSEKRIKSFSEIVLFFKDQFHIRTDNSLRTIIEYINRDLVLKGAIFTFSNTRFYDNIELFTDVDKLRQAYKHIIMLCLECRKDDTTPINIELEFYDDRETNHTYFIIHHVNSIYNKTLKNASERIGQSQSHLIEKKINGLCDLFVEAEFEGNECGRINLWDESPKLEATPLVEKIKGVKYIMRF